MQQNETKDENVFSFMMQLVQEKHGDDVGAEFLNTEAERLYIEFGDELLKYFEPMLNIDQKSQFDNMVESGAAQDEIMNFLVKNIEGLEQKIMDVLNQFRQKYIELPDEVEEMSKD